ncbi:MAG: type IV secretory system conjugative DNA transfer family protein [Candidatus Obscuribacterales bacterium]|nr:type IV secretory system conjugative DNA transfer family protein [Candidatus Obscuribacterales bacterium]
MPTVLDLPEPLVIHLPAEATTVVINNALTNSTWRGINGDIHTGSISATLDESKSWFQDKPWQLSFHVLFRWEERSGDLPGSKITLVRMKLTEKNHANNWQLANEKLSQLIEALREEEQEAVRRGPVRPDPAIHPTAAFATVEELQAEGFLGPVDPQRFVIAATTSGELDLAAIGQYQFIELPIDKSERHVLVCGPTGTGKSSAFFIPNLFLRTKTSAIVTETTAGNDPPDLWSKTAGFREAAGQKIYYFNPDDLASWRVNPLDQVNTDSEARAVTELLMRTTTQSRHKTDQFWDTSERMLLSALMLHAVGEREHGNCNLGYIYDLMLMDDRELKGVMANSRVPEAARRFKNFISRGTEQTRNIVLAALSQRLALWGNTKIRALTETTDINMQDLQKEIFTFYISFPSAKQELKPLAILVWNYILDFVSMADFSNPVMLLLDEFAGFGYLSGMRERLAIIRHKHIGAAFGIQDEEQIKITYEKEAPLFFSQPATKIFLKPQELSLAIRLRDWLGRTTIPKQTTSRGQVQTTFHERFLASADELLQLDETKMLVFLPGTRPSKLPLISHRQYSKQLQRFRPPIRQAIQIDEKIKLSEPQKPPPIVPVEKIIKAEKTTRAEKPKEPVSQQQALDAQKAAEQRTREQMLADQKQDIEWRHLEEKRRMEELQRLEEAAGPLILDDDDF